MLTDYHLHLRPDALEATAAEHFTAANARRYRAAASARGISELGVSEHVHRFRQALALWRHPFWVENATDDLDSYCAFVGERTDLRLGIEADYLPELEEQTAGLLGAYPFDYVVGSVHFLGHGAVDMDEHGVWREGADPEQVWRRYFQTLGRAAASGLFDVLAHPDLVKVSGDPRRRPEGDLRRFYELAIEGIAESGIAVEVSTAGLRKPVGEIYPAPEFLQLCLQAGAPVALSSDAHRPQEVGFGYEQALALLRSLGVQELCVFEGRRRRMAPLGELPAAAQVGEPGA